MKLAARYKITGLNFLISHVLILLFLIFAWFVWFPSPFAEITGFNKTALIIILTNLCLGPLLVFIVFKEHKKHLRLDLSVLAIIQVAAFVFGAYSLYLKHPVYAVFTVDRFTVINAKNATPEKIKNAQLQPSLFSSPKMVFAKRPDDPDARNKLLFAVLFEGEPDLDQRAEYYEPFKNHLSKVLKRSIDPEILFPDALAKQKLADFLVTKGGGIADYGFFPLQGSRNNDFIWVLNRKSGKLMGIIDSDPWQIARND